MTRLEQSKRYLIASLIALSCDYGLYWSAIKITDFSSPTAAVMGYSAGLVIAYFLMAGRIFKNGWLRNNWRLESILFVVSGVVGLIITYVSVLAYVSFINNNIHLAKLLAVSLSFIGVFAFRKYVVFYQSPRQEQNRWTLAFEKMPKRN